MLLPGAEPELGHIEDAIDHVEAAADTIVGKFGLACRTDDEERRSLTDRDARWKHDKRLSPVVEGAVRPAGGDRKRAQRGTSWSGVVDIGVCRISTKKKKKQ